jgi:cell wall-associated NlpC family hydrolase
MPDTNTQTTSNLSDAQTQILQFAEEARVAAAGKPYTWGGSTTAGFDCSGFVTYVFNKAYGAGNPPRLTAEGLRTSSFFSPIFGDPAPADVIFFSSDASTASHVAIVVSSEKWIGSQSSTGVAYVSISNPYWKPKILCYRRHITIQTDSVLPLWAGTFGSMIA